MKIFHSKSRGNINSSETLEIKAAEDSANKLSDIVDEKSKGLEDDFDYVLAGIDKLCREDKCNEAIMMIDKVSEALNSAVNEIGDMVSGGPSAEE